MDRQHGQAFILSPKGRGNSCANAVCIPIENRENCDCKISKLTIRTPFREDSGGKMVPVTFFPFLKWALSLFHFLEEVYGGGDVVEGRAFFVARGFFVCFLDWLVTVFFNEVDIDFDFGEVFRLIELSG